MAEIQATFNLDTSGSGSCGKELWIDLGSIPTGKQLWFGFASLVAIDKDVQFEIRTNLSGYSDGTAAHTELQDFASAQVGASIDRDLYRGGAIFVASAVSTGVEHWWLRCQSVSQVAGLVNYIFYYALY